MLNVFAWQSANGLFAFTVSDNTENNKDYFMVPSGRFVHNINYVEKLLVKDGFPLDFCAIFLYN